MFERLEEVEEKYLDLEKILGDPRVASNPAQYQRYAKEHSAMGKLVETYRRYREVKEQIANNTELMRDEDEEIREMAKEEVQKLRKEQENLEDELKVLLLPKDPNDERNTILEIRAGTGGEEAALFVADLFRMYSRFAERRGWKVEIMSSNPTGIGGFKEIIALISGENVYSQLKYESGVHRVQRVPVTEAQGRIHTSAVTVALLPEAEEVDVYIDPADIRVDVYRSSGPGGQSVNTTDSAVRVTHIPTGLVVTCQDEKSQHKNKAKALKILRARLLDKTQKEQHEKIARERKSQIGTGDRSERIRTYNFPQGRMTDHRIGLTLYRLDAVLGGELEDVISPLIAYYQAEALKH
ncbi:MAG: peptide chain release factor 1 [Deltaproteobacteria bacterium]|jgi:peptide chain release factor 1|nr:MAG: peptide chain release factor 1 [Deltaproteobacteria bacterium]